jgi:hypothetical protein
MREDLPTMILLNTALVTPRLAPSEEELLYQAILDPISSTILLRELTTATTINIRIPKHQKI